MAETGEKRFPATPHRRREAREKGQVARSMEINTAVVLVGGFMILRAFTGVALINLQDLMKKTFAWIPPQDITLMTVVSYGPTLALRVLSLVLPFAVGIGILAMISNLLQVGFMTSWTAIKPQLDRLNPLNGIKRIFSARSLVDFIKSLLKVGIAGSVTYMVIKAQIPGLTYTLAMDPVQSVSFLGKVIFSLVIKAGLALAGLAVVDFLYQKWEFERSLRMSRQDIKEELLRYEGRPEVKQRIRTLQRQFSQRRMMEDVAKADVVITNPTRLAIALAYDPQSDLAPVILAKGSRTVAEKIKEKAREFGIPMVENKPLAQALFKVAEIGQAVPVSLFQSVAEVLAYLYRVGKAKKRWM